MQCPQALADKLAVDAAEVKAFDQALHDATADAAANKVSAQQGDFHCAVPPWALWGRVPCTAEGVFFIGWQMLTPAASAPLARLLRTSWWWMPQRPRAALTQPWGWRTRMPQPTRCGPANSNVT